MKNQTTDDIVLCYDLRKVIEFNGLCFAVRNVTNVLS